MAGGTWTDQNKVLPGVYINYSSSPSTLASMGERGVVCIGKSLNWGEEEKVIVIEDPSECFDKLGYDQMSDQMYWLRQILLGTNRTSGASKILVWRLAADGAAASTATASKTEEAKKASATLGNLQVQAVTAGTNGNALAVSIEDGGSGNFVVKTFSGDTQEDSQTVTAISGLTDNAYVTFSGTGDLAVTAKTQLTGGASAFSGSLQATAVCKGTRGNEISVIVTEDPDNAPGNSKFYVQTLVSGKVVDNQTISASSTVVPLSGIKDNAWVKFTKSGNAFATSMTLSGGANGTLSSSAYSNFMSAMELETWNVLAYGDTDSTVKSALSLFVKRLSNDEGKKVQACLWDYPEARNECVISVYPQNITDSSGHVMSSEEMVCWVSGCTAGANINEALTYASHPDAASIAPALTQSQQINAINGGQFAMFEEFGVIKNLQDINTFRDFTPTKGKQFRKNRVIRTVFGIANDTYKVFAQYYIGVTSNDAVGRGLLKAEVLNLLYSNQGAGAIQNVVEDDVEVNPGTESDSVVIGEWIQPIDSVEKIYINITIS